MSIPIVNNLLRDLNSKNINYCHWKSNEHLQDAVSAKTDLDILFDESQKTDVEKILQNNRFYYFESVWYRRYHDIVDYIGFDNKEGCIVHVHTHFRLNLGEVGIKSYSLPWEKEILDNKIFDSYFKIYKNSPKIELLLLIIRTALKLEQSNPKTNKKVIEHYLLELPWLNSQSDFFKLEKVSNKLLNKEITSLILSINRNPEFSKREFLELKQHLKNYFKNKRIISPINVRILQATILYNNQIYKLKRKLGLPKPIRKRVLPTKGIILSLMGSDGAGKSTQAKELTRELSKKIDVEFVYMGSGNGPKSWHRNLIEKVTNSFISSKSEYKHRESFEDNTPIKGNTPIIRLVYLIKCISLAIERRSKLKRVNNLKDKGVIIICDRYPQTNQMGYNDGPKLHKYLNSKNTLLRAFSKFEFASYDLSKKFYPDLVIKLVGNPQVLHKRRPEMSFEEIKKKQNGILNLEFNLPTRVKEVNIERSVKEIKADILGFLSENISHL